MGSLLKDVRYGLHLLVKNPGSTALALLALALGIGANSAIFCVLNAVVLKPLPFRDPGRLVEIRELDPQGVADLVSPADYVDWKQQNDVFSDLAAFEFLDVILTGMSEPLALHAASVTPSLFKVLGVDAVLGRTFVDGPPGAVDEREVVLSDGFWRRRLGADPRWVGKQLTLNGQSYLVVGVAPRAFAFPREVELFMRGPNGLPTPPSAIKGNPSLVRNIQYFEALGRLRPGISVSRAQAEMETIEKRLAQRYPDADAGRGAQVISFSERLFGRIRPALLIISAACTFVLLIACANVASLLLARTAVRAQEIAVRAVLGAQRGRLTRQILVESVVLTILGGGLGILFAVWGTKLLVGLSPVRVARLDQVHVDGWVVAFTALISVLTGLAVGIVPAARAAGTQLRASLNEVSAKATSSVGRRRTQSLLVISEIAIALVLLVGAGLLIKSLLLLRAINPGFEPRHVLTVQVNLPRAKYSKPLPVARFFEDVVARVKQLPGVVAVAGGDDLLPAGPAASLSFDVEGRPKSLPDEKVEAWFHTVTPGYFHALGIPLLAGRDFDARDARGGAEVVIINRTMARRFWSDKNPIGKRISFGKNPDGQPEWVSIIGVVGDVRYLGLSKSPGLDVFSTFLQSRANFMSLIVRASGEPLGLARAVKDQVLAVDPDQPIGGVFTMNQLLADSISDERFLTLLLALLAGVAMVLAVVGIYGVMSFSVTQRRHEVGIRVALGACRVDVLRLVIREAAALAMTGVAIGVFASLSLNRALANRLFGVSTTDPAVFASLAVLLVMVALLASYIPARRATAVDPNAVLR